MPSPAEAAAAQAAAAVERQRQAQMAAAQAQAATAARTAQTTANQRAAQNAAATAQNATAAKTAANTAQTVANTQAVQNAAATGQNAMAARTASMTAEAAANGLAARNAVATAQNHRATKSSSGQQGQLASGASGMTSQQGRDLEAAKAAGQAEMERRQQQLASGSSNFDEPAAAAAAASSAAAAAAAEVERRRRQQDPALHSTTGAQQPPPAEREVAPNPRETQAQAPNADTMTLVGPASAEDGAPEPWIPPAYVESGPVGDMPDGSFVTPTLVTNPAPTDYEAQSDEMWARLMSESDDQMEGDIGAAMRQSHSDEAAAGRRADVENAMLGRGVAGGGYQAGQAQVALGGMQQRMDADQKIRSEQHKRGLEMKMAYLDTLIKRAEASKDRELQAHLQKEMNDTQLEIAGAGLDTTDPTGTAGQDLAGAPSSQNTPGLTLDNSLRRTDSSDHNAWYYIDQVDLGHLGSEAKRAAQDEAKIYADDYFRRTNGKWPSPKTIRNHLVAQGLL